MLLILALFMSILLVSIKSDREGILAVFFVIISAFCISLFDSLFYLVDVKRTFFQSDELTYYSLGEGLSKTALSDRWGWVFLNKHVNLQLADIPYLNKLLPVFSIPVFVFSISKLTNPKWSAFFFIIFPFCLHMFGLNLRDMVVYSIVLFSIVNLTRFDFSLGFLTSCFFIFLLIFLRPFYVFILLSSIFVSFALTRLFTVKRKFYLFLKICLFAVALVVVLWVSGYGKYLSRYLDYAGFLFDNGFTTLGGDKVSFGVVYLVESLLKFVFTPLPFSLFDKMLNVGFTSWGPVHDISRLVSQLTLYTLIFFVAFVLFTDHKRVLQVIRECIYDRVYCSFFIFSVLNTFLYAIYYGGGGHGRTKVLLYLSLFVFVFKLVKYKNKR